MTVMDTVMEIVEVDPHDDAALEAWHAAYFAADRAGRELTASPWHLPEIRESWRAELPHRRIRVWSGLVGGEVAVAGYLEVPLLDNPHLASVEVHTLPARRGRGHGTAMLGHLERAARDEGRTVLMTEAAYPYEAPADGVGRPNVEFLAHRGFRFGLGDVQRALDLPVADELLAALAAEAAPHHAAYAVESFSGPVPDAFAAEYAALGASLMTEAPTGDLEVEAETPDVAVLRAGEELMERQGRQRYSTVAFAEDGSLAGYTDLVTSAHEPGRVFQWGTLVAGAHRGHRLGLALKTANLRFLQGERAHLRRVTTYNAEVNAHMIGVNERLGFRPVERLGEFQKRL
jgi:GNAT superfamily N-acetyltransferase